MCLAADIYQQFDSDPSLPVSAEGFGGWCEREIELAPIHTTLVDPHAQDHGSCNSPPGWRRAVEYLPRAEHILNAVFPPLRAAVRASPIRVSPEGMVDMARPGCLCSTIREAVTAVESRETAGEDREKQQALWRLAVEFGSVFRLNPFLRTLPVRFP